MSAAPRREDAAAAVSPIFEGVEALTFDCYGTIVDWEAGILAALGELLDDREGGGGEPDSLLERFGRLEAEAESGVFRPYRAVLRSVAAGLRAELGAPPDDRRARAFAASVSEWPAFPDSREALRSLGSRYRLAIVSNVDDDLFAGTAAALGIDFDEVVTAQQVRGYKPGPAHFREVLRRLELPLERVVHVAQSLYHDVAPAKALGFRCVWVDRRAGRSGGGATPPATASPDLVVPSLEALASVAAPG